MREKSLKKSFFKLLAGLICICALVNGNYVVAHAETKAEKPLAVLFSATDFQNKEGHAKGEEELKKIINKIYNCGHQEVTEAMICGDYYHDEDTSVEDSAEGIAAVQRSLQESWNLGYDQIYFVQGNHDPDDTPNLDETGGTDREYYSVYQINHDDYMWNQAEGINREAAISETAENLEVWLAEKIKEGYRKPVFVISHLPLHHSYRYDNRYSEYIFDALNEAGEKGLNIFYLFGHNHAKEYDSYLGGSAVFFVKGEEICIPDIQGENVNEYKTEKLNFTYMNAGYIGHTSDNLLSSCIFTIYEDRVEVCRYSSNGVCNLKNKGISSEEDLGWSAYENEVEGPQMIPMNDVVVSLDEDSMNIMIDSGQSKTITLEVKNAENYEVAWSSSNPEAVEVVSDGLKAVVTGKQYGTAIIEAVVNGSVRVETSVFVAPENAVRVSYGDHVRFYGLKENLSEELLTVEGRSREYMIVNQNQQGDAKAFASQTDEYTSAKDVTVIYVPGIGNIVSPYDEKNVLWNFEETEGALGDVTEYRMKVSSHAPYRYKFYVALTSGIDSGLGYPNISNMRTCSKDTSDGAALFWVNDAPDAMYKLQTSHHYKNEFKDNENGTYHLCYDLANGVFCLDNTSNGSEVYYYGKIEPAISDLLIWTDAQNGTIDIGNRVNSETGGTIKIMYGDTIEEFPITLEMLSGYDESNSGKYSCTLKFNGQIISENYELIVENSEQPFSAFFSWLRNFFERIFN